MPTVSRESASRVEDRGGMAVDRSDDIGGYTVNFVSILRDSDLGPLLRGLPDNRCQCPHWGYMFKGRMVVQVGDSEEVIEAGQAFYLPPGHSPRAEAGAEFVQISPAAELATVVAHLTKAAAQLAGA